MKSDDPVEHAEEKIEAKHGTHGTAIDLLALAKANGGLAINNVLSADALRPLSRFLYPTILAAFAASIFSLFVSIQDNGKLQATLDRANDRLAENKLSMDRIWYWATEDYAQQLANGGHPPPLPQRPAVIGGKEK